MTRTATSIFILLLSATVVFAQGKPPAVQSIEITGTKKMRPYRMLQYMETKIGEDFDEEVFAMDVDEMKSWMYFEYVRPTVERTDEGVRITIDVKEKWTMLPEIDFDYAGGAFKGILGIRDNNFLGYRQTAVLYGGYRAGDFLAGLEFYEPRIAGSKFGFYFKAERDFYADPFYGSLGDRGPDYINLVDRIGGRTRLEYEPHRLVRFGPGWQYFYDRQKAAENSPDDNIPRIIEFEIPKSSVSAAPGFWLKAGKATVDDYIFSGGTFETWFWYHHEVFGSRSDFFRAQQDLRGYLPLPYRMNLTGRIFVGFESSDQFIEQYAIGSMDSLRGYPDRRFRGRGTAFAEFEYRWLAGSWWWFTWMPVAVFDVGSTWDHTLDEIQFEKDIHAGAGPGLRWIFNKWDNAILRIDVAWPLTDDGPPELAAGMDMYF